MESVRLSTKSLVLTYPNSQVYSSKQVRALVLKGKPLTYRVPLSPGRLTHMGSLSNRLHGIPRRRPDPRIAHRVVLHCPRSTSETTRIPHAYLATPRRVRRLLTAALRHTRGRRAPCAASYHTRGRVEYRTSSSDPESLVHPPELPATLWAR